MGITDDDMNVQLDTFTQDLTVSNGIDDVTTLQPVDIVYARSPAALTWYNYLVLANCPVGP